MINALDNLTGSGDLISVRNRGTFTRPFTRVVALRQQAERAYRAKEQELIAQLEETERRLVELEESNQGNDDLILTDAQRDELLGFRQERVRIRKDLRGSAPAAPRGHRRARIGAQVREHRARADPHRARRAGGGAAAAPAPPGRRRGRGEGIGGDGRCAAAVRYSSLPW